MYHARGFRPLVSRVLGRGYRSHRGDGQLAEKNLPERG